MLALCFQDALFVSKHVVLAFSQSLKCAISWLKSVLAESPGARWFKMWGPPSPHPHPRLWFFETYTRQFCFPIKMDQGIKANRGLIISEKPMYWHDDKPICHHTESCMPAEDVCTRLMAITHWSMRIQLRWSSNYGCETWLAWSWKLHFQPPVLSWDKLTTKVLLTQLRNVTIEVIDLLSCWI